MGQMQPSVKTVQESISKQNRGGSGVTQSQTSSTPVTKSNNPHRSGDGFGKGK